MRGVIRLRETGRPELVYGQPCPEERLEHEVWVTEAELLLEGRFLRNASIGKTTADALLIRDGIRFYVEVDNETEIAKQLRQKWLRYGDLDGYILVICHTKRRLRRLLESAELVKDVALFSRFRWLGSPRVREPWIDWYGKRTRI